MVRNKNVLFLALALIVFLNSPAYPKSRKISHLPSDTNMVKVSKDYTHPYDKYDKSKFIELTQLPLGECEDDFKSIAACRKCARLREKCPNCCLTILSSVPVAIKCTEDASDVYRCTDPLFQEDECLKASCGSKSGDSDECDDKLDCSGGLVLSGSPYGLHRRGCPEEDSEDLAPDGNCKEVDGSCLDRVWECEGSHYQPIPGCSPESGLGLSKPSEYYSVVKAVTSCTPGCTTNPCSYGGCGGSQVLACTKSGGQCSPSCSPYCSSSISSTDLSASATCTASGCGVSSSCYAACKTIRGNMWDSCEPQTCSSSCGQADCKSMSARWKDSPSTFYIYKLSQEFKEYITACTDYANEYETCEDKVTCCQKNVCSSKEPSGYEANCTKGDKCEERMGCINTTFCDEDMTEGECIENVRKAAECLIDKERDRDSANDLSEEISSDVRYEFTARNNESLTIDWQVVLDSLDSDEVEEMKGISFYTLIKVEEVGSAVNESPAHISALSIRDMENAFSIYGLTHVPEGDERKLTPGKKYVVKIYYFFPQTVGCQKLSGEYKSVPVENHKVWVKGLYLNIVMVKE